MRYIGQESYGVLERGIPANNLSGDTAGESEEGKQIYSVTQGILP